LLIISFSLLVNLIVETFCSIHQSHNNTPSVYGGIMCFCFENLTGITIGKENLLDFLLCISIFHNISFTHTIDSLNLNHGVLSSTLNRWFHDACVYVQSDNDILYILSIHLNGIHNTFFCVPSAHITKSHTCISQIVVNQCGVSTFEYNGCALPIQLSPPTTNSSHPKTQPSLSSRFFQPYFIT